MQVFLQLLRNRMPWPWGIHGSHFNRYCPVFCKVAGPVCTPSSSVFPFTASSPNQDIVKLSFSNLRGEKWHLILIGIFLITSEAEHLFAYLLDGCSSSSLNPTPPFFTFSYFVGIFISIYCTLDLH